MTDTSSSSAKRNESFQVSLSLNMLIKPPGRDVQYFTRTVFTFQSNLSKKRRIPHTLHALIYIISALLTRRNRWLSFKSEKLEKTKTAYLQCFSREETDEARHCCRVKKKGVCVRMCLSVSLLLALASCPHFSSSSPSLMLLMEAEAAPLGEGGGEVLGRVQREGGDGERDGEKSLEGLLLGEPRGENAWIIRPLRS